MSELLLIEAGKFRFELRNEPTYSPGSCDNPRLYGCECLFCDRSEVTSRHGLICWEDNALCGSAIFLASGGCSSIHMPSIAITAKVAYFAVGDCVACLQLPSLHLLWSAQADPATVFGVYSLPSQEGCYVHGEIAISRLDAKGNVLWSASGADIFTGEFRFLKGRPTVSDFVGHEYCFDPETGKII